MKILSLLDKDVFIEAVIYNCTNEWIEEIVLTYNGFKALNVGNMSLQELSEISEYIKENETTLVEIREIL